MRAAAALALAIALPACGGSSALASIARELESLAPARDPARRHAAEALLSDLLAKDAYTCTPPAAEVLAPPPAGAPERTIEETLPHYGLFQGPVRYRVGAAGSMWRVRVNVAVTWSVAPGTLELSDCALAAELEGPVRCEGTPYEDAPGLEACPDSGRFQAPATRHNVRALLERWSERAEALYNRDAARYRLPVRYDFELFLADDADAPSPIDVVLPLWTSCGRTPYFIALRSGWSVSVVAHELGHYLGLLDEYEALSGITSAYPKTPFAGSERSRMGVSMKRHTRMFPLHHYLVLRRYHCGVAERRDPFGEVLR